jgi:hypothetical protein
MIQSDRIRSGFFDGNQAGLHVCKLANGDNGRSVGAEQLYLAESIEGLDGEADLLSE